MDFKVLFILLSKVCSLTCTGLSPASTLVNKTVKQGDRQEHIHNVIATLSGKQTHSEGQCRQWSAVYYTGGPKADSPFSQGPRPAFVKIFYTPCVHVQTHHPNFIETYINKGRVNTTTITPSFTCYVFKQLIINKPAVTFQLIINKPMVTFQPVNNL